MRTITFSAPCIKRYETSDFHPSGVPQFVAVSLNGEECHLQCDHCRTRMLKALYQINGPEDFEAKARRLVARGCRGMLLTGGCRSDGTIPLEQYVDVIQKLRMELSLRFAVHTKLVTEEFADAVEAIGAELLMSDIVGDDESLQRVYHLRGFGVKDVRASLDRIEKRNIRLAPHIMMGIANGQIVGEYAALDMLLGRDIATLALVALTPLLGTPMADVNVDVDGVMHVMSRAREMFPHVSLTLGCAKLGGKDQRRLEEHALQLGFDAIAYPSDGIVEMARAMGYNVRTSEMCCAFMC